MLWTIIVFAVGWLVGRNWDQVKQMYHDKMKAKHVDSGNVTKID